PIQIPNSNNVYVSFWVAFHKRLANQRDTVELMIESDCKNSFTNSIYTMTVQNAATYDQTSPVLFVPSTNEHWKRHVVQIPTAFINQKVYFNFRSKSYKGGSFWLGQFAVHEGEDFVSLPEDKLKEAIKIYPNPTESFLHVEGEGINSVRIIDMQGKLILAENNTNASNLISLNVENLRKGVYTIHIVSNSGSNYFKFIR
ncbi:MAG TPA: T9SS type A sorting domain-containing protein, partial [Bacteroidia bacterium]